MTFLHAIGDFLRVQFDRVPLSVARWLFIAVFLGMLLWVVQLPSKRVTADDRQSKWFEDLRVWAWLALMIQIVIYGMF